MANKTTYKSFINKDICKKTRTEQNCNDDCIIACPTEAISIIDGTYAVVYTYKCIGCGVCALMCPVGNDCIELKLPPLKDGK